MSGGAITTGSMNIETLTSSFIYTSGIATSGYPGASDCGCLVTFLLQVLRAQQVAQTKARLRKGRPYLQVKALAFYALT